MSIIINIKIMKTIQKIALLLILTFSYNCKAQRITDATYISYYNSIVPTLNDLATNKAQFYGQNFSSFYAAIVNNNLTVLNIGINPKIASSRFNYVLTLKFAEYDLIGYGIDKGYQNPKVRITFVNAIPDQVSDINLQYKGRWNTEYQQFFSNMIIESIEFGGINGYNNPDRTPR